MKYRPGQRVIALFALNLAAEGTVIGPSTHGRDTYLVHLDEIPDRDYVMTEGELTTIEELFG